MSMTDPPCHCRSCRADETNRYEVKRSPAFSRRATEAPYFPPAVARPGKRIARVVANMLPCECRARVIETWGDGNSAASPVPFVLDALPTVDGPYVVVENSHGGQMASDYVPELHAGWARYSRHECGGGK